MSSLINSGAKVLLFLKIAIPMPKKSDELSKWLNEW